MSSQEESKPLMAQDIENGNGYNNPNIPAEQINAAIDAQDKDDAASMISGGDGAIGAEQVLEKGVEGQAQPIAEALKDAKDAASNVFEKKESSPKDDDEGSSSWAMFISIATVVCFIAFDCGKVLMEAVGGTGHSSFNQACFLAFIALLNIALALACTGVAGGVEGLKSCFSSQMFLFILPSLMFSGAQLLTLLQNSEISPDLRKVLQQLRIPITAVFSRVLMGHAYTQLQWFLISCVVACVCCFQICASTSGLLFDPNSPNNFVAGFAFSLGANIFASAGSILAEKYCKSAAKTPFYIQKFQIEVWTFFGALLNIFLLNPAIGHLGDMVLGKDSSGSFRGPKQNPVAWKSMLYTYSDFKTSFKATLKVPKEENPNQSEEKVFANRFDMGNWESKQIDLETTIMGEKLSGHEYADLVVLLEKLVQMKKDRSEAKFDGDASDYNNRRAAKDFDTLISGKDALWKPLQKEGKFITSHGLKFDVVTSDKEKILSNFGFTYGTYPTDPDMFESSAPFQRASLKLNSWWLAKKTVKTGIKDAAPVELWTSEPSAYFTWTLNLVNEKMTVEEQKKKMQEWMATAKAKYEKANFEKVSGGEGKVKPLKKNLQLVKQAVYKATKPDAGAASYDLYMLYDAKTVYTYSEKLGEVKCTEYDYPQAVVQLTCPKDLIYENMDNLDSIEQTCTKADVSYENVARAKKCELTVDGKAKKEKNQAAKDAAEKAEKDKSADTKKAEKEAKEAEDAKEAFAKIAPLALVKKLAVPLITSPREEAKDDEQKVWLNKITTPLRMQQPDTTTSNVQVWNYPGHTGSGAVGKSGMVCDRKMCEFSDDEWSKNFKYMGTSWQVKPFASAGKPKNVRDPFAWGRMHEYTRWWMPAEVWSGAVIFAIIANMGQSWLSGLIAKVLSSLWKNLCQAAALALVIILQRMLTDDYTKTAQTIGVIGGAKWTETIVAMTAVLLVVWIFSQAPKAPKPEKK